MRKESRVPEVRIRGGEIVLPKLAFRIDELVFVLGLSKSKIRDLLDSGRLAYIREGAAILITHNQLEDYLDRMEHLRGRS